MTLKLTSRKKGVSSIISAMLLIVIVMSAFSLLYASSQRWISAQRWGPLMAMQERFIIEDTWFRTVSGTKIATIYVRNAGEVDVTVLYCRIDEVPHETSPLEIPLPPGAGSSFNVTISWVAYTTYKITIVSERGSSMTSYETP